MRVHFYRSFLYREKKKRPSDSLEMEKNLAAVMLLCSRRLSLCVAFMLSFLLLQSRMGGIRGFREGERKTEMVEKVSVSQRNK